MDFNIENLDIKNHEPGSSAHFSCGGGQWRFFEAANRLHITQSTVSARMQNFENYLGTKLFVRNRAGATLTPAAGEQSSAAVISPPGP